jgi:hypothetical protein
MPVSLPVYAKIKDNYCISYYGNNREYLLQLKVLRPIMESMLPGIKVYISCKEESIYLLKGEDRVIPRNQLQKDDFAYVRELVCNMECHPVEELMKESNLPCGPIAETNKKGRNCVLCTNGILPTKTLSSDQIHAAIKYIKQHGVEPTINEGIEKADWIVGVENEDLFGAALLGKKATLIPTGLGENLFIEMFPQGEILRLG